MMKIKMTYSLAMAAAKDAGNRNMKKNGRTIWNREDYNVVREVFDKLIALCQSPHELR